MKKKQLLSGLLAAILLTGTLAGCGAAASSAPAASAAPAASTPASAAAPAESAASGEAVTLTMYVPYGDDNSRKVVDYAAEKTIEKFPNVTFEFENFPQDAGATVKARAATGDLPDIIIVDSNLIDTLAPSGNIMALDDYYEMFNYGANLRDSAIENCVYSPDGHIYQFTTGGSTPVLWYYNEALFEQFDVKVPTNYDELLQAVQVFQQNDIIPLAMFGKEPWPLGAFFDSFMLRYDTDGLMGLSEGQYDATNAEYAHELEKMQTLIEAGIFPEGVTNTDFDTASAMFLEGRAAMIINGAWYNSDIALNMPDTGAFMPYYPTADAGQEDVNKEYLLGVSDTQGFAVNAAAENPDFVAEVAATFAYERDVAEYVITQFITGPIKTDGLEMQEPLSRIGEALLPHLDEYVFKSKFLHIVPNTKFATGFAEELQKFFVGESVENFMSNVDALVVSSAE